MLRETTIKTSQKPLRKNTRIKYRGITGAASALGVHRIHLYLVLEGKRVSKSLLARYRALKRANSQ